MVLHLFWHLHFADIIYQVGQQYLDYQEFLFLSLATFLVAVSLVINNRVLCMCVCVYEITYSQWHTVC